MVGTSTTMQEAVGGAGRKLELPNNRLDEEEMLLLLASMSDLSKRPQMLPAAEKADYDAEWQFEMFGGDLVGVQEASDIWAVWWKVVGGGGDVDGAVASWPHDRSG